MTDYRILSTPLGELLVRGDHGGLTEVRFCDEESVPVNGVKSNHILDRAVEQLVDYFAGRRTSFDLPLNPSGTKFQKQVWQQLLSIQYGDTASYGNIAKAIGNPTASRAVGAANGRNPIAIIVPCHRVIGANGTLTGYAGGLKRKQWLLEHENSLKD